MRSTRHGVTSWINQVTVTPGPLSWPSPDRSTLPVPVSLVDPDQVGEGVVLGVGVVERRGLALAGDRQQRAGRPARGGGSGQHQGRRDQEGDGERCAESVHGCLLGTGACCYTAAHRRGSRQSTVTARLRDLDGALEAQVTLEPQGRDAVQPDQRVPGQPGGLGPPAAVGLEQHDLVGLLEPQRVGPADRGVEDARRALERR